MNISAWACAHLGDDDTLRLLPFDDAILIDFRLISDGYYAYAWHMGNNTCWLALFASFSSITPYNTGAPRFCRHEYAVIDYAAYRYARHFDFRRLRNSFSGLLGCHARIRLL